MVVIIVNAGCGRRFQCRHKTHGGNARRPPWGLTTLEWWCTHTPGGRNDPATGGLSIQCAIWGSTP